MGDRPCNLESKGLELFFLGMFAVRRALGRWAKAMGQIRRGMELKKEQTLQLGYLI